MIKKVSIILFILITNHVIGQNSFQYNLYELNDEIQILQSEIKKTIDDESLIAMLELTKKLNRLSEEASYAMLKNNLDSELSDLINFVCELGKQKLNMLIAYKRYKNEYYLKRFNDLDKIYLSVYLKVKTIESETFTVN
ncbi:hypothetical protein [Myroides odoratimimus]|uniref:Uncharacterized protein n=1 Tax=Myroides odoratimimus TaxID=76832 RepID=A0AAI8C7K6_9FLAO|nr:hypothetical protein [Myroides odoratimimus]ALU27442.1 hypothetical protein AS202_15350 [Myroides odoratimimus]MDM1039885.1 hypothetical protein [Myroides odoratimimus]MDM1054120.1 hypothetical protein [Myroides odoratimimus]MDM1460786.1 hypothetical protein [Myroides odoratimimus]